MKYSSAEIAEARAILREAFPAGSVVYLVSRHLAGRSRRIDAFALNGAVTPILPQWLSGMVRRVTQASWDQTYDQLRIGGGTRHADDSALIRNLSTELYGEPNALRFAWI